MQSRLVAAPALALVLGLVGCEQLVHTRDDGSGSGTTGASTSGHSGTSSSGATGRGNSGTSGSSSIASSGSSGSSSGSTSTAASTTGSTTSSGTAGSTGSTTAASTSSSSSSTTGTTGTAPGAPTGVTVLIDGQPSSSTWTARLSWQPPASAGSSAILFYTVNAVAPANPGGTAPPPSSASYTAPTTSTVSFGPLVDDAHYAFTVTATNAAGTSAPSAPVQLDACVVSNPPSFALSQTLPTPSPVTQVLLHDLNGDGLHDVVAAAGGNVLWGIEASSGGSMGALRNRQVSTNAVTALAVGDLNGDTLPDVVALGGLDATLYLLLGAGQGDLVAGTPTPLSTLASLSLTPTYTFVAIRPGASGSAPAIEVADTSNNQVLDVEDAVPGPATATANPINNQNTGGVLTGLVSVPLSTGAKFDVVTPDDAANIDVWSSQGTRLSPAMTQVGPGSAQGVAAADLDGDGLTDLVIGQNAPAQGLSVLMGTPAGFATQWRTYPVQGMSDGNQTLAIADVNGDRIPDIINANTSAGTIGVLLGVGDGGFAPEVTVLSGLSSPSALAAGDFTGDGHADLAVGSSSTNEIWLYVNSYPCH